MTVSNNCERYNLKNSPQRESSMNFGGVEVISVVPISCFPFPWCALYIAPENNKEQGYKTPVL